jgi:hypothetical protein
MCQMTLLSNTIELSMLSLNMFHMDLTLYNSNDFMEIHHSIFDIIMINLMCHMHDPIEQSH